MLQKTILRRAISFHCCKTSIFYSEKDTSLECNSLIYCYDGSIHKMYKIDSINGNYLYCFEQGRYPVKFSELPTLCWNAVGVYRFGPTGTDLISIAKSNVTGKVLKICDLLITCPNIILREK